VFNNDNRDLAQSSNTQNTQVIIDESNQEIIGNKTFVDVEVQKSIIDIMVWNEDDAIEENLIQENEAKEIVYKNVFGFGDTAICGLHFETEFSGDYNSVVLPDNVKALKLDSNIRFLASRQGSYTVYYSEIKGNINIKDSLVISFQETQRADVSLSKDELCPGEELLVYVRNNKSEPVWNTDLKVNRRLGSAYAITGLNTGNNLVSFSISDNSGCTQIYSKSVNVLPQLNFEYFSTPNVCSGSNATLTVKTSGQKADLFTLNNNIESETGHFKGLDPGIWVLSVEYEKGCVVRDTLLIRDSLNVSPYFIAEKDLINRNKYSFRNLTNVDDKGYERNANVVFVWKVNGNVFSVDDNPEYEFVQEGHNIVELIASINENCQNIYSETIFISGSNFRIPNIFTPNGDGIGDEFVVVYEGELRSYKLDIINRTGEVIYESTNIEESWDGKFNGNDDAAEGLYYYIIRGEDKYGNNIEQKGSLRLVRN
jgi:gliding motility-associated-like protein